MLVGRDIDSLVSFNYFLHGRDEAKEAVLLENFLEPTGAEG